MGAAATSVAAGPRAAPRDRGRRCHGGRIAGGGGARDVTITFRVTNDDPAVPTTRLEVFLPTVRRCWASCRPPTGWTARVATAPRRTRDRRRRRARSDEGHLGGRQGRGHRLRRVPDRRRTGCPTVRSAALPCDADRRPRRDRRVVRPSCPTAHPRRSTPRRRAVQRAPRDVRRGRRRAGTDDEALDVRVPETGPVRPWWTVRGSPSPPAG